MSSIEERVKKIVVEQLGVKEEEVTEAASFVDDLGADSLDTVVRFQTKRPRKSAQSNRLLITSTRISASSC